MDKLISIYKYFLLNVALAILPTNAFAQRLLAPIFQANTSKIDSSSSSSASLKMSGNATLITNFVEHGVSQTNNDPALQGSYMFHFGSQIKMGLWGSNVYYPNELDHFNLKLAADAKFNFAPEIDAYFSYTDNRFYKSNLRNGATLSLLMKIFQYEIELDHESNWEGTSSATNHLIAGYSWKLFPRLLWDNNLGYNSVSSSGYKNYFDYRSTLALSVDPMIFRLSFTYNSSASQFNGRGKNYFILSINTDF